MMTDNALSSALASVVDYLQPHDVAALASVRRSWNSVFQPSLRSKVIIREPEHLQSFADALAVDGTIGSSIKTLDISFLSLYEAEDENGNNAWQADLAEANKHRFLSFLPKLTKLGSLRVSAVHMNDLFIVLRTLPQVGSSGCSSSIDSERSGTSGHITWFW
ncbi:hypothetical protein BC829DRAFT_203185 [Chytridium lagenaria]|nr:hypothetical protein BC829DRAFT_203185 [Chytridium lagenaria]